jgi:hypothetical protein
VEQGRAVRRTPAQAGGRRREGLRAGPGACICGRGRLGRSGGGSGGLPHGRAPARPVAWHGRAALGGPPGLLACAMGPRGGTAALQSPGHTSPVELGTGAGAGTGTGTGKGATSQSPPRGAAISQNAGDGGTLLREANRAKAQLRDLQLKFDSQQAQLRAAEEELSDTRARMRKLRAELHEHEGGEGGHGGEGMEEKDARRQARMAEEQAAMVAQRLDRACMERDEAVGAASELRLRAEQLRAEHASQCARIEVLEESLDAVKSVAFQYESENRALSAQLSALQASESGLRETLAQKQSLLGGLEDEAKLIGRQKSDAHAARRESNRGRRQLLLLADGANRAHGALHSELLAQRRLLEELKREYEEHAETVRTEWNSDRKAKMDEQARLKQQLDNLKLIQFEDKQQLLREQREVVKALQTQFEEYRRTAEFLFQTEARKLEDKLRAQTDKYEEEIRYIVRAKDLHFDLMMTAKDAKILNLIEGSDLQNILVRHEQELEQTRRAHVDDLEAMRVRTEAASREAIQALHRELAGQRLAEDKLRMQVGQLEEQLRAASDLADRRAGQEQEREARHLEELAQQQRLLSDAHAAAEKLNQEKQDLRHRIVRLTFESKGDADETLPNLVKRMSLETAALKAKLGTQSGKLESAVQQLKQLQSKFLIQSQHLEQTVALAAAKDRELREMFATLSRVLYSRIQGKFGDKRPAHGASAMHAASAAPGSDGKSKLTGSVADHMNLSLLSAVQTLQRVLEGGAPNNDVEAPVPAAAEGVEPKGESPAAAPSNNLLLFGAQLAEVEGNGEGDERVEARIKTKMPRKLQAILAGEVGHGEIERVDRAEVLELARGISYLNRFEKVTAAYAGGAPRKQLQPGQDTATQGAYRYLGGAIDAEVVAGQRDEWWKGNTLYDKLRDHQEAAVVSAADRVQQGQSAQPRGSAAKEYRPAPPPSGRQPGTSKTANPSGNKPGVKVIATATSPRAVRAEAEPPHLVVVATQHQHKQPPKTQQPKTAM